MSTIRKIPDSLQFYFKSDQNASAVNQILESDTIPLELNWLEVEHYNTAKVSAQVTQLDHWRFLKEIWELTWGEALKNSSYKEVDPIEYGDEYSMEHAWIEGYLYKILEFKDNSFYFYCGNFDDQYIRLGFYVESKDETYDVSNNLELSSEWDDADEDNERCTSEKLVDVKGKAEIDIEPLINLANEVILKLSNRI